MNMAAAIKVMSRKRRLSRKPDVRLLWMKAPSPSTVTTSQRISSTLLVLLFIFHDYCTVVDSDEAVPGQVLFGNKTVLPVKSAVFVHDP